MMARTPAEGMVEAARVAGVWLEAVAEQEAEVVHMLEVLAKPDVPPEDPAEQAARTEAAFDNMPV